MAVKLPTLLETEIGGELIQTVNARSLHISLEVATAFGDWIRRRKDECQLEENVDYIILKNENNSDHAGRPVIEWFITLDAAKEICMLERSARGKEIRKYFIECEKQLKTAQFDSLAALDDPDYLRSMLLKYAERNKQQSQLLIEQAPKIAAHNRIAEAYGSVCITDAAKTINVPPKTLIRFLRQNGWTYRRPGTNDIAYQSKIQCGFLIHKVHQVPQDDGTERSFTQVRVTPKGMLALAKYFPPVASVA